MSADRLREAARVLRERAESATGASYHWTPLPAGEGVARVFCGRVLVAKTDETIGGSGANAAYIATMHPGVGLALADWLDDEAGRIELADNGWDARPYEAALRLADLILGSAS